MILNDVYFRQSIYETRLRDTLGIRKNLTREEWKTIDCALSVRKEYYNKHSTVYQDGRPLSEHKISKERRRYRSIPIRVKRPGEHQLAEIDCSGS